MKTHDKKPFIEADSLPNRVEVQADGVAPKIKDPDTGSRIPSMSTGGAAINAMMKTDVADRSVGIMITPNHPM